DFRKRLGSKDNLLIYYAGHGEFDKTAGRAYWLPVNAQRDDPVDWISATDITDNIKRIASRHILIVSDSCYSGTLTRAAAGDLSTKGDREQFIKKMMERPSRTLMASGGNEPVADEGGSGHSVFADAFLRALKEADKGIFTAEELFHGRLKTSVAGRSDQVPEYNDIKNSGHDGGDFVFQLASIAPSVPAGSGLKPEPAIKEVPTLKKGDEGGFSLEDLVKKRVEKEKQKQIEMAQWNKETEKMQTAFNKVMEYQNKEIPPEDKIEAWKYFKDSFSEENPYSEEDDKMRKKADEQIAMAKRPKGGAPYTDPATGMEFIFVKGGCFQMGGTFGDGGSYEKPVHEVCVDDLYMGKYEVTQAEWQKVMGNNPSLFKNCDNCPVEKVSWNDIQEYINKLNEKNAGAGFKPAPAYRLPTEAEWEYAARSGGKNEKYAGGNDLDSVAWYSSNSGSKTHPVGQKNPNGLGIYDMSGNVWEWVNDWYDDNYYKSSPRDNPQGANSGQYRALRGGSWDGRPLYLRASYRDRGEPTSRLYNNGFRLSLPSSRQ
ncbi:MAG TPA: SUMF1/EgtB/PvdO family nonheme iron enzyme, partial [Thermodesulfobacteriota bacterium]|nr:SUMF1/EgtB/PvdO family nonheme iron enzyme [Thermodesulfobacteriota bacterium]